MTGTRYEQAVMDLARDLYYVRLHVYDLNARPWNALSGQEKQLYILRAQNDVEALRPAMNTASQRVA